jgi:hypothetical protein
MIGPVTETDPASASPKPSRIVFFPSSITFAGISSYFVFTMNSVTYFVSPDDFGNSSELHGRVAAAEDRGSRKPAVGSAAAANSNEFLKK